MNNIRGSVTFEFAMNKFSHLVDKRKNAIEIRKSVIFEFAMNERSHVIDWKKEHH